jgi:hypothetical protein
MASSSPPGAAGPPPYPPDTRAKGWRFELDYERIEQSSTWALAGSEARPWLLMLWLTAWRQVPCGSLPAEEDVIAALIGMQPKAWVKHRGVLLRGWVLADDGRLYHPTVGARVLEMLDYRRKNADRVAKFKAAQREQHGGNALPMREQQVKNDTGTGTGTIERTVSKPSASHPPAKAGRDVPPCPYEDVVALYHQALPELPSVRVKTEARLRAIKKRWNWVLTSLKSDGTRRANSTAEGLDWMRKYFERARSNDFLMGSTTRNGEHANWRCDIDYLMTDRGLAQVIEKTE